MTVVNIYMISLPDASTVDGAAVAKAYPENSYKIRDGIWVVASELETCGEVADAIGIGTKPDARWPLGLVGKIEDVNGFMEADLWEKLNVWMKA